MLRSSKACPAVLVTVSLLALAACDDKPSGSSAAPSATPSAAAPKPLPIEPVKAPSDKLPDITVDDQGPLIGSERVDMAAKDAQDKLNAAAAKLPLKQKTVEVSALRSVKTQHVAALVTALGAAGAIEIDVKTPGRSGAAAPLKLTPERMVAAGTPDCAIVGMVKKNSTSTVWHLKGGTAKKFSKGFAGPDLSMTFDDGLKKDIPACSATTWFFSAEDDVVWGLAFDLASTVTTAQPPLKTTTTVLLHEAPIAGRPVKLLSP